MTKILIGYITNDLGSGINQYIINFVKKNYNEDVEIDFLVRDNKKSKETIENKILNGIKYNKLFFVSSNKKPLKVQQEYKNIFKNSKYDIAYFNISAAHDNYGLIAAKKYKVNKIIVHSHCSSADGQGIVKIAFKKLINNIGKIAMSNSANIYLACSDKAAKWLFPSYVYNTGLYDIIYNCIESKKFKYNKMVRNDIRTKLNINDKFVIGHVGRAWIAAKNNFFVMDILKETIKKYANTVLLWVGDGPDFDKIVSYAKKIGVYNNVIFTHNVNNVEDYLQAMDVFILPSKFEGLPIAGIEAQFANLPCFFSDRISKDVTIGEKSILLPINSSKKWCEEILKEKGNRKNKLKKEAQNYDNNKNKQANDILKKQTRINSEDIKTSYMSILLKLILVVHYICNLSSYLNGFNKLTIVTGILMIGIIFINIKRLKEYLNNRTYLILIMFMVSYLLSICLNNFYDVTATVKVFIWTIVNMFFTNSFLYNKNIKQLKEEMKIVLFLFIIVVGIFNLLNMIQLALGTTGTITSVDGEVLVTGISSWGRFYGVYYDPNYSSVVCTLSILICLYLFSVLKNNFCKVLVIILNIISYMYICFCESRSGLITCVVGLLFFGIIKYIINQRKKLLRLVIVIITIFLLATIIPKGLRYTYNSLKAYETQKAVEDKQIDIINNGNKEPIEKEETISIGRSDNKQDVSNRRFDIWKSGLEIYKTSPIYGIGYGNVVEYAKRYLPNTYIVNNNFNDFNAFHNFLMDVLVNQGLIGIIITMVLFLTILINICKKRLLTVTNYRNEVALIISSLISICFSGMFLSHIFYVNNAVTFMFWLMLGFLNVFIERCNNE